MIKPYWYTDCETKIEFALIISAKKIVPNAMIIDINEHLESHNIFGRTAPHNCNNCETLFEITAKQGWELFAPIREIGQRHQCDVTLLPTKGRNKKLILCDMDSTIVIGETLDDIAQEFGIGKQVSEITAQAMRGEIDFQQALKSRIKLLTGANIDLLHKIAVNVRFNSGAEQLVKKANQQGIHTVLISGGLETVVSHVAATLGFDSYYCNRVECKNGRFTGKVYEPIIDAPTKLQILRKQCQLLDITLEESCCIGDGANDLPMLEAAGLGVAFQAKQLVKNKIACQLNYSPLDSVLAIMGSIKKNR